MINSAQNANNNFAIKIQNSGGYIAEFFINYQVGSSVYKLDSGAFSLGFSRVLNIPQNAEMIYLTVDIWIFGGLRHLVEDYISTANHCFNLTGTIFDAVMNEVPCDLLGDNGSSTNPPVNKCCRCCCRCCCRKPNGC